MPDIFWDGVVPLSQMLFGQPDNEKLIISEECSACNLPY